MPEVVPIEIFNIARTTVNRSAVRKWLDFVGAEEFSIPPDGGISDPSLLIALAAKRCYKSFVPGLNPNVSKIREDYGEYLTNILKSGHGSVLEHSVFSFAIENISRVFTAEMNRHRAGWAISEGSLRFIRFDKSIPFWQPTSLTVQPGDDDDLRQRKEASMAVFIRAFSDQEQRYSELLDIWDMDEGSKNFMYKKKVTSCLRRIVGMGVATGGVWSGNVRALRHVITMRTSPAAEEEILHVFSRIAKMMRDAEPLLFGDFTRTPEGFWVPRYVKV